MTADLEFEGKNVEKAAKTASEQLNIPIDQLKYDVISYGSTGIFGLVGTRKARIKVIVPPEIKQKPETLSEDINNNKRTETFQQKDAEPENFQKKGFLDDRKAVTFAEDPEELGRNVIQKIIDLITTGASISSKRDANKISFKIEGGNAAILIGKRGQTLESIQYLVEKIVNKHNDPKIRTYVDVEGYLEARKNSLRRLATRLAEQARLAQKPMSIGQMNSQDRRVVHIALKDNKNVRTQSIGDGYYRKLVIFPVKNSSKTDKS